MHQGGTKGGAEFVVMEALLWSPLLLPSNSPCPRRSEMPVPFLATPCPCPLGSHPLSSQGLGAVGSCRSDLDSPAAGKSVPGVRKAPDGCLWDGGK